MKKTLFGLWLAALGVSVFIMARSVKAEDATKAPALNWYMIESKHTGPECIKVLDDMNTQNLLDKTYWGCRSGDHRGWTMLQAPSKEAALKEIPESQRAGAKIVQVGQFTAADLQAIHASKKG